ncbi:MAG: helix-turn-helix transcriptional regulator [Dehalococcoidia bacterium]
MAQHFNPDRLEALRLAHGFTRAQFAEHTGLTRQAIYAWASGSRTPSLQSLERIAKAFDIDTAYFFADTVHHDGEQTDVA